MSRTKICPQEDACEIPRPLRDTFQGKAFRETFRLFPESLESAFLLKWKDGKFPMTLEWKPRKDLRVILNKFLGEKVFTFRDI